MSGGWGGGVAEGKREWGEMRGDEWGSGARSGKARGGA